MSTTESLDVIVVGAGAPGLAAARTPPFRVVGVAPDPDTFYQFFPIGTATASGTAIRLRWTQAEPALFLKLGAGPLGPAPRYAVVRFLE